MSNSVQSECLERSHAKLRSSALAVVITLSVVLFGAHVFRQVPGVAISDQSWSLPPAVDKPLPLQTSYAGHLAGQANSTGRTTPQYQVIGGQEVVLERVTSPVGILLIFHGCQHSAIDWWDAQDSCPACIGLPEEKAIVKAVVQRKYAVVAFSSMDRGGSRCWSLDASTDSSDLSKSARSWEALRAAEGWEGLPVFALGGSSGGAFVGALPLHMKLQGACIQIMAYPSRLWQSMSAAEQRERQPPVLFVHMERDLRTAGSVANTLVELLAKDIVAAEIVVKPQPLHAAFFSERIDGMSPETSADIYTAFAQNGMLDTDGMLLSDPRSTVSRWQALLQEKHIANSEIPLESDASPLFEVLNVAWAGHELISATTDKMLDFFEAHKQ